MFKLWPALAVMITAASPVLARGRAPSNDDTTVSSTGSQLPAHDQWRDGTGPSSPNSQGVAGNPKRNERYETQPSGADFPQGTAAPTTSSGTTPSRMQPAPMNR